ncbi:MAG: NDP-sugar synthase [Brachyspira sp.]|nr:NDP-sugar synthase [Brachyspira sp.]
MSNKTIKAMIMAAGVGSRLDPLTKSVPKPLVPVANRPVMDILVENLKSIGVKDVVSNTHYLAEKIINRYENINFGVNFKFIKEDTLSGTAGGLKKCQFFFDKDDEFLVLSADGLSNADLQKGIDMHRKSGAIATIGIKEIPHEEVSHFGVVVTDENGYITEFQEKPSLEEAKSNFINTGIYVFDYRIFDYIPENTFYDFAKNVFPNLLKDHEINTFVIDNYWTDIGTLEQYQQSTQDLFEGRCHFNHSKLFKTASGAYISNTENLPDDLEFDGNSTIGSNCKIGKNVTLKNAIIWDNVTIEDDVVVSNSVIASGSVIRKNVTDSILGANSFIDCAKVEI